MHISRFRPLPAFILAASVALLGACASAPETQEEPAAVRSMPAPALAEVAGENYAPLRENTLADVRTAPVSTFSVDVDTAAYANVRRFINHGQLPPAEAVRIEEMINYFDYDYAVPRSAETPFTVTTEVGPTPWNNSSLLLHVGIKGYAPERTGREARNLVFLIDVSGSMYAPNKLELLKKSLRLLVRQLSAADRVAIVVYAGSSGMVLPSTPGNQHGEIIAALERLRAGGSTNGGAGIQLAYAIAEENFVTNGVNRVILATDGDFNVGTTGIEDLKHLIKQKKRSGVGLTILGFGMGNYNDRLLEEISNAGDGNAAYIDTLQEAQKVLVHEVGATLHTIARDAKIQIEFNPQQVRSYRLIGYENRLLSREDFSNDRVDAGDVGAGHTVTALYEIVLNDGLRYQAQAATSGPFGDELAQLRIRYKRPNEDTSRELVQVLRQQDIRRQLNETTADFRFSAAVAAFGQLLRRSRYTDGYSYSEVLALGQASRGDDRFGYRSEFLSLVKLAETLN